MSYLKYKLYTLDEIVEFAKEHNIQTDENDSNCIKWQGITVKAYG